MTSSASNSARVAALLSIDPNGLGGVWIRARHGPGRDALVQPFTALPGNHGRILPGMADLEIFGGVDLAATLMDGAMSSRDGLLKRSDIIWLAQAERLSAPVAARLTLACDQEAIGPIILLDEASEADEFPPHALIDHLAFFLSDSVSATQATVGLDPEAIAEAQRSLTDVSCPDALVDLSARTAAAAGCHSARPALFVLRAARAIAALEGCTRVGEDHLSEAAALVLAHRVTTQPEADAPQDQANDLNDQPEAQTEADKTAVEDMMKDIVLEAAATQIPEGLLGALIAKDRRAAGSGQGAERVSYQRGRPMPPRAGIPDGRKRLDLLATLQAAAPWQRLRNAKAGRQEIRQEDLRVRRFEERAERMLIFLVDASGSAAMARLAEAKGAAETLLAEAYRSRDHVCMISFRGDTAERVLEPTKSLARAKRLLGGLPGGGATPLAAALMQGTEMAITARKKGLTPYLILMTDGRANKALDGSTDRAKAGEDASAMARHLSSTSVPVLIVDSGLRPSRDLTDLAAILSARTIRLPRGPQSASKEILAALDA